MNDNERVLKKRKVLDDAKLICRIKHALIALYQAYAQLSPNEQEYSEIKNEINNQISRLRDKLKQIAGIDALNKFDEYNI